MLRPITELLPTSTCRLKLSEFRGITVEAAPTSRDVENALIQKSDPRSEFLIGALIFQLQIFSLVLWKIYDGERYLGSLRLSVNFKL
jgi:hypothetical protein